MKIKGPLHSDEAHGTISDFLTFSRRRTGQQARWQNKQKDKKSVLQLAQRAKFLNASFACRFMEYGEAFFGVAIFGNEKTLYTSEAREKNLTEYNLCISQYPK